MFRTILFDLDDTIFDFKESERAALTKTLIKLNVEPTEYIINQYSKYNISQWKRLELGEISREEVKVNRYKLLFDELGLDISPQLATSIYEENLAVGHYFIDGAVDMLEQLYQNYNLYLVSNGAKKVQDSRLASADISHYFKDIIISETVGFEKPSEKFFNYCFERIPNFNKSEAIIIGDSLSSDIKGGINAGIKTIWFNPHNQQNNTALHPDYEIHSLHEAVKILNDYK